MSSAQLRYRALVEQMPAVTFMAGLDEGTHELYISPQIEELVGYTAEEWVADPNFFAKLLHPDDRDRVLEWYATTHRGVDPFDDEYRLIARDGRIVWIHAGAVIAQDEAATPVYAQGYMIDVTARREAEQALHMSEAQLRRRIEEIEHQSLHDSLTGLPNRSLFHDRIEQALGASNRTDTAFAVMMIDLDRFKEVNDTLGDRTGDRLLKEVGRRLRAERGGVCRASSVEF